MRRRMKYAVVPGLARMKASAGVLLLVHVGDLAHAPVFLGLRPVHEWVQLEGVHVERLRIIAEPELEPEIRAHRHEFSQCLVVAHRPWRHSQHEHQARDRDGSQPRSPFFACFPREPGQKKRQDGDQRRIDQRTHGPEGAIARPLRDRTLAAHRQRRPKQQREEKRRERSFPQVSDGHVRCVRQHHPKPRRAYGDAGAERPLRDRVHRENRESRENAVQNLDRDVRLDAVDSPNLENSGHDVGKDGAKPCRRPRIEERQRRTEPLARRDRFRDAPKLVSVRHVRRRGRGPVPRPPQNCQTQRQCDHHDKGCRR